MIFHKVLSLAHTHQPYHSKNSSEIGDFEMEKAEEHGYKAIINYNHWSLVMSLFVLF